MECKLHEMDKIQCGEKTKAIRQQQSEVIYREHPLALLEVEGLEMGLLHILQPLQVFNRQMMLLVLDGLPCSFV